MQIWNVDKGGLFLYDKITHSGWSSIVFFKLNNETYFFAYKKASGEVFFLNEHIGIVKRVSDGRA